MEKMISPSLKLWESTKDWRTQNGLRKGVPLTLKIMRVVLSLHGEERRPIHHASFLLKLINGWEPANIISLATLQYYVEFPPKDHTEMATATTIRKQEKEYLALTLASWLTIKKRNLESILIDKEGNADAGVLKKQMGIVDEDNCDSVFRGGFGSFFYWYFFN